MLAVFCVRIYKHVRLQPVVRAVTDASEIIRRISVLNPCVIVRSTYASIHLILLYACYIDVTGQQRATPWRNTPTSKEDVPLKRRSQEGRQESSSSLFMYTVALTQNCLTASHFWMSRCFSECQDLRCFLRNIFSSRCSVTVLPCVARLRLHSAHVKISDVWMRTLVTRREIQNCLTVDCISRCCLNFCSYISTVAFFTL